LTYNRVILDDEDPVSIKVHKDDSIGLVGECAKTEKEIVLAQNYPVGPEKFQYNDKIDLKIVTGYALITLPLFELDPERLIDNPKVVGIM
jgi:hypothetical protein